MTKRKFVGSISLALASLFLLAPAAAQEVKARMGHVFAANSSMDQAAQEFAKLVGERTIEWGLYGAAGISSAVNDESIVCQMERDNVVEVLGLPIPEVGYDVGGLSGAPLFALWQSSLVFWCGRSAITAIPCARHARYAKPWSTCCSTFASTCVPHPGWIRAARVRGSTDGRATCRRP